MITIQEKKASLRKVLKEKRSKILNRDYEYKCNQIEQLLLPFINDQKFEFIHCFVSMNKKFEVNTHPIIEDLLSKGKTVIVPVMNGDELEHSKINSTNELVKNTLGILEPKENLKIDTRKIDLILVPLLGVDIRGNRLGYGKGYYDKFLQTAEALKIGLAFEEFVLDEIPSEKHDVKLDGFITEKGVRLL